MKKLKKVLLIVLGMMVCYLPMQAAGYYQTKKVQYGGANFYYDGVYQNLGSQMVAIDGTTYMPVKALCQLLGLTTEWDSRTQTVRVSGGVSEATISSQAEIQAKNYEIIALKRELEKYKASEGVITSTGNSSNRITATTGTDILGSELTATRKALVQEFEEYFDGIEFDFSLSLSSSKLKLTISYDTSSENKVFNALSSRRVKQFLGEICETIRKHHEDIVIEGKVQYNGTTKSDYTFSYSKKDVISYTNQTTYYEELSPSEVIKLVEQTKYVNIEEYSNAITISDVSASVSDSRERITFRIYLALSDEMISAWNKHMGTNKDVKLRGDLRSIARDINRETDYDILGEVYTTTGVCIAVYDYEENELITQQIN